MTSARPRAVALVLRRWLPLFLTFLMGAYVGVFISPLLLRNHMSQETNDGWRPPPHADQDHLASHFVRGGRMRAGSDNNDTCAFNLGNSGVPWSVHRFDTKRSWNQALLDVAVKREQENVHLVKPGDVTVLGLGDADGRGSARATPPHGGLKTTYFAFVPPAFSGEGGTRATSPTPALLSRLADILERNPEIDAVGTNVKENGVIKNSCHSLELCHWTLLQKTMYYCSTGNLMRGDGTSSFFVARQRVRHLLDLSLAGLAHHDFFLRLKAQGGVVVTVIDELIDVVPPSQFQSPRPSSNLPVRVNSELERDAAAADKFIDRYGVTLIKDYHASATTEFMHQQLAHHRVDLCTQTTCDGGLYERLMGTGNHWKNTGTSMPVFFFEQYALALVESIKFLEKENVTYSIFEGGTLGFLKFNGLLPWDTGDVDIQVDPESVGGCDAWLSMLKAWADGRGFIHPHVAAACTKEDGPNCVMARGVSNGTGDGANCIHYGVYVGVPKGTNVADPFSMGLTTFTKYAHNEIEPTAHFRAYGMSMRVPENMGKYNMREYGSTALQHISSVSTEPDADADNHHYINCKAPSKYRHNCVGLVDGTRTPRCLAHTPFVDGGPRAVAAVFGG